MVAAILLKKEYSLDNHGYIQGPGIKDTNKYPGYQVLSKDWNDPTNPKFNHGEKLDPKGDNEVYMLVEEIVKLEGFPPEDESIKTMGDIFKKPGGFGYIEKALKMLPYGNLYDAFEDMYIWSKGNQWIKEHLIQRFVGEKENNEWREAPVGERCGTISLYNPPRDEYAKVTVVKDKDSCTANLIPFNPSKEDLVNPMYFGPKHESERLTKYKNAHFHFNLPTKKRERRRHIWI